MIDPSARIYRTRKGHEVRVYATDGELPKCIHGAYWTPDGWSICDWHADGTFDFTRRQESALDLIEVSK